MHTYTHTVTVDFAAGRIVGMPALAGSIVEFIQEDRVAAEDDTAMVCAEVLAHYAENGSFTDNPALVARLVESVRALD